MIFEQLLGPDTDEPLPATESNTSGQPAPRVLHSSVVLQRDNDSSSTFREKHILQKNGNNQ